MSEAMRRHRAVTATMAKFGGRDFDWKTGATCIHMARFHLRQMGHKPPALPRIGSALAARRALDAAGHADMASLFDGLGLLRIAPASLWIGDLAILPGDAGLDGVVLALGGGEVAGWREDAPGGMVRLAGALADMIGAWRL